MATKPPRFEWYELLAPDMAAAAAFYGKVLGWTMTDLSLPGMRYALFAADGIAASGLTPPRGGVGDPATARWVGYVGVDDVDAATEQVRRLGGSVTVPPTEIPGFSRFAVVTDPQMAAFLLVTWLRPREQPPTGPRTPGLVGWCELHASDYGKAFAFYSELFSWQKGIAGPTESGQYQLFSAGRDTVGGMLNKLAAVPLPFWLYYFNVRDIDAAAERVKAAGGQVIHGPDEVPDGSWILQCVDPQAAAFGLVGKRPYGAVGFLDRVLPRPSAN